METQIEFNMLGNLFEQNIILVNNGDSSHELTPISTPYYPSFFQMGQA